MTDMQYAGRLLTICMLLLIFVLAGCGGGEEPEPPLTDTPHPPEAEADSTIGSTDTTTPPENVALPDNIPEAERAAATLVLKLGGHITRSSAGHVEQVDLTGTDVTDADLKQLADFPHLLGLLLSDTDITNDGLKHVAALGTLTTLELNRCNSISDEGLQHISNLSNLGNLYLKTTSITDGGLAHIAGITTLTILSLSNTAVTDDGLKHLSGLNRLETLIIEDTDITAAGIIDNLKPLKKLIDIRAAGTAITDADVVEIQKALRGVRVTAS